MISNHKKSVAVFFCFIQLILFFYISAGASADNLEFSVATGKGAQVTGIKVYAFTGSGTYTGVYTTTTSSGTAIFDAASFQAGNYKFRADYLGGQFWSDIIPLPETVTASLTIPDETALVTVTTSAGTSQSVKVYLFTGTGTYLGINKTTDTNGEVAFDLPVGRDYKFRADILSNQYWSSVTTIQSGTNNIPINAGGGVMQVTVQKYTWAPMAAGILTYLYNASGTYLGITQTTGVSGIVQFNVPAGNYKVRADYLGYQYWSAQTNVTGDTGISIEIPHQDAVITVQGNYQGSSAAVAGIKVYLYTASGTYMGQNLTTDSNGQVTFNLPQNSYKVRADYMNQQFWSENFTWQNSSVNIPMADAEVAVSGMGQPLENVRVYLFTGTGTYLGLNITTDSNGKATFRAPAGSYKLRADYQASQYWSNVETLIADQVNPVAISTGGGILSFTVTNGAAPLSGVSCYLFTESGTYLGLNQITGTNGAVSFPLTNGNYKIRVDYLGYQFWSASFTVPDTLTGTLDIPHQDAVITVQDSYQGTQNPVQGANVYLFTSSGTYMGQTRATDANGQVTFNLPQNSYKVRADYMSQQFWSGDFTWQNSSVNIPMAEAEVTVTGTGQPLENVNVYLFTGTGAYLGVNKATDSSGKAIFRTPSGLHKFRADYMSSQYWSNVETLIADQVNPVSITTGGGIFDFTVTANSAPLVGVNCYLFTESGTYLGLNKTTDTNGVVSFPVSNGNYKIRVDYLGNQFWSANYTVPDTLTGSLEIPHQEVVVTVQDSYQGTQTPLQGVTVYLFTSTGTYMAKNLATDINGQVVFNLPQNAYKVRADYMGQQFWSEVFTWQNRTISIPKGMANIHVKRSGDDVPGARVYLFTTAHSYLGKNETADSSGMVSFQIPSGQYLFRADDSGVQKWSSAVTVITDQTVSVEINMSDVPEITASADPAAITDGESTLLTWQTTNAETVTIDQGVGTVELSGSRTLSPTETTTYTITAEGQGGSVNKTVTIDVVNAPLDVDLGIGDDEQQGGGGLVGETVRVFNGNVIDYRGDLNFSSPNSLGLSFSTVYNSRSGNSGSMGYGWTHTYEMALNPAFDVSGISLLKITDNTGRAHYFREVEEDDFEGVFGEKTTVAVDSGVYIWNQADGSKYGFSSTGQMIWLDDPSGNRITLNYGTLLNTVTDQASGRVITFHYNAANLIDHITGPNTTAVADGIWVEYGYDANNNLTSVLYADNSGFDYLYTDTNDIHNLTEKKNKAGHLINTWGYNTTDRATSNFSRDGKGVNIVYESNTQVNVTDAYGKTREYLLTETSGRKRVNSIIDGPGGAGGFPYSDSNVVSWVYDANMNPTETETPGGTVTQYSNYDEKGNPGTVKLALGEPEERVISYTYHPYINTPLTRSEPSVLGQPGGSKQTIWDYDNDYDAEPNENPTASVSRVIEKGFTKDASGAVVPYEYITAITYNSKGQVLTIDGPAPGTTDTTTVTYNPSTGDVLSITRPLIGATTYSGYDNAGQVDTITDVNNQSKIYIYDARGRVTDITNNADSSVSSVMYNTAGLPEIQSDEDAVDTSFEYEATYGRLFKRFDHEGNYIQYEYDSQGNVTEKGYFDPTNSRSNRNRYLYQDSSHNMPGKLFREINGDDTYTLYGYDLEGNVASVRNPNGNTTNYIYDPLDRIKTVTQPGSITTTYGYDKQGNLASVTDAESNVTTYQYDDMGRLVSTTSPDTGTITYVYDEAGNPVNKTDANGITVDYDYDVLNRLTNVNFPDTTQNIIFSYDQGANGKGQRTGMTDKSGSTTFSYDSRGRLTGKSNIVEGITYNLSRVYTPGGRMSTMTYPTGRTVDYHRASCMCKVDSITTTYNSITETLMGNLEYRPFGGAKAMNTGGGGTIGSAFNDAGRMTVSNPGATHEKTYTYDNNGNLTSITAPSLPYQSRVYGYDDLDRLTHAEGPWGTIDYTYDDVGNRQTETVNTVPKAFTYETGTNKLDTVGGTTIYTYDDNGNIVGIGNRSLIYNQDNRLVKVEENSNVLGEYTYNGLGQRIKKVVGTTTTIFHYDFDGNIIGESSLTGTFSKEYLYRSSSRLAMVDVANGAIYFYGNDSLGTPQILTDSTNTVVWEATYKPFGEAAVNPNSTVVNNFRFAGQYYDSETGLHYNYHRYYDPSTGRYITTDPIGLEGGLNLFVYTRNNPANYIDPKGLNIYSPTCWKAYLEVVTKCGEDAKKLRDDLWDELNECKNSCNECFITGNVYEENNCEDCSCNQFTGIRSASQCGARCVNNIDWESIVNRHNVSFACKKALISFAYKCLK